MNRETSQGNECGFVHPFIRLHASGDQKTLSSEAVSVLASVLSTIWLSLFIPFVSPAAATWIITGAVAALFPAIWLMLRNPKKIWRELKSGAMYAKGSDLRKLYISSPNLGVGPNRLYRHANCRKPPAPAVVTPACRSENSPRSA